MLSYPQGLLHSFVEVANLSGFEIRPTDVLHEVLPAPHKPPRLPRGKQAVYVFSLAPIDGTMLKVGKAGPKSNARFQYQHYQPASSQSNLAKSLLGHPETWRELGIASLDEDTVGDWLKTHTARH